MQLLEERIRKDGIIKEGNVLKVDRFLNHQMDIHLFEEIGKEFYRRFSDAGVNKILTIEANQQNSYNRSIRYRHCLHHGAVF